MLFNWERHIYQQGTTPAEKAFNNFQQIRKLAQGLANRNIACISFPVFADDTRRSYPGLMIGHHIMATFAPTKGDKGPAYILWRGREQCQLYKNEDAIVAAITTQLTPPATVKNNPAPRL